VPAIFGSQTGFLDCRRHDICRQGEISGIELETARLGLCGQRFHRPPVRTEHVGDVQIVSWGVNKL